MVLRLGRTTVPLNKKFLMFYLVTKDSTYLFMVITSKLKITTNLYCHSSKSHLPKHHLASSDSYWRDNGMNSLSITFQGKMQSSLTHNHVNTQMTAKSKSQLKLWKPMYNSSTNPDQWLIRHSTLTVKKATESLKLLAKYILHRWSQKQKV